MASLTETAYYTRKTINWAILIVVAYIILRFIFQISIRVYLTIFPPKPAPPNHAFNILPPIAFPKPSSLPRVLTYKLETIEGSLPTASESATVYFMPKKPANLLALTKTESFAKRLQFSGGAIQQNKNIYAFVDLEYPLRKLQYDIISDNFVLTYTFAQDLGLFANPSLPTPEAALNEARNLLQTWGIYNAQLTGGTVKTTYLKLKGDTLITVATRSLADAIRVDFFRKSVGNTPILSPNPDEGPVSLTFSGSKLSKKHLLRLAYTLWPIDFQTLGTYALISSDQAWTQLQEGRGYIARYPQNSSVATVRNVYLAYYDSFEPQTYLQPVFVFEGDDGFLAYVSAVAPPWTEQ